MNAQFYYLSRYILIRLKTFVYDSRHLLQNLVYRPHYSNYDVMIKDRAKSICQKYQTEAWFKEIQATKKSVLSTASNIYYRKVYEKQEIYYWFWIPKWIYELTRNQKINTILDIGCAYGTLSIYTKKLSNCDVYCLDMDEKYLSSKLISQYKINFKPCNVELDDVPFDSKFDLVLLTDVIEHFNFNLRPTLAKIKNCLAIGGKIMISTPDSHSWGKTTKYYDSYSNLPFPRPDIKLVDDHVWQFSMEELLSIIIDTGLKIDKFDYSPGIEHRHINLMLSLQ